MDARLTRHFAQIDENRNVAGRHDAGQSRPNLRDLRIDIRPLDGDAPLARHHLDPGDDPVVAQIPGGRAKVQVSTVTPDIGDHPE